MYTVLILFFFFPVRDIEMKVQINESKKTDILKETFTFCKIRME